MRKRLTARSVLMASFAALGGGCGSVLAPQIVKFLGGLWHVFDLLNPYVYGYAMYMKRITVWK
jgi:hypothetical protein